MRLDARLHLFLLFTFVRLLAYTSYMALTGNNQTSNKNAEHENLNSLAMCGVGAGIRLAMCVAGAGIGAPGLAMCGTGAGIGAPGLAMCVAGAGIGAPGLAMCGARAGIGPPGLAMCVAGAGIGTPGLMDGLSALHGIIKIM